MRTLFAVLPTFDRFDIAGSRFQATRKTNSMWYPVWHAMAAGLIENSRVVDSPAGNIGINAFLKIAKNFEMLVIYTSTASLSQDIRIIDLVKAKHDCKVVFVGPHVSLKKTAETVMKLYRNVDYIARREYDYTIKELSDGKPVEEIEGLTWKNNGQIVHNQDRPFIEDLDKLPFVSKIYKRDLDINAYHLPFTLHPYISIMTGRSCPYKCNFCLYPQVFLGRKYRVRSPQNVIEEINYIKEEMPAVKEIFFDDDTFTAFPKRVSTVCDLIRPLNVTWSCNARADVKYALLKKMKDAGCRLLVVGYESGNQEVLNRMRKGITIKQMREFTKNCKKLGFLIHGTFVLGLLGETRKSIQETIDFSCDLNLDTVQFSVATPLPGTDFYRECKENDYLAEKNLVDSKGYQESIVNYPWLRGEEIVEAVEKAHIDFYFRVKYWLTLLGCMLRSKREIRRIFAGTARFNRYLLQKRRKSVC